MCGDLGPWRTKSLRWEVLRSMIFHAFPQCVSLAKIEKRDIPLPNSMGQLLNSYRNLKPHGPHGKQNPDKNDGLSHFPEKIQFAWVTKGESPHHSQMTSLGFPGAKTGEPGEWGIFFSHPPNEKPWFLSGSLHINGTIFSEAFNIRGMRLSSRSRGFYPNNHMCHMGFNENAVISMWCTWRAPFCKSIKSEQFGIATHKEIECEIWPIFWGQIKSKSSNHTLQSNKHGKNGKRHGFWSPKGGSHQPCSLPCGRHLGHFGFDDFDDFGCGWQREAAPAGPGAPWSGSEGLV